MKEKEQDNSQFFTYDNLEEIADFNSHLSFAEKTIEKYQWNQSVKADFQRQLQKIRKKQNDKLLNISVIGEFSTGKSTFINALMRSELLSACSLQGTTVASTVIEYSPDYAILLQYNDDSMDKEFSFKTIEALKACLEEYTTDPDKARHLNNVRVCLPSEQLKSKFRIIDTPGTNAIELWHEDVTRRALSELSDVSIILIDANKPLPESFCNFIENNLEHILPQCIFVVTKIDLVKEKERKRVLEYIKVKLKQSFGLESPLVLPYVSVEVIDDYNGSAQPSELLAQSYQNEEKILAYTGEYRMLVQAKKLIALIDSMYDSISAQMDEMTKTHKQELELLQRSKQADLSEFIDKQKRERLTAFDNTAKSLRTDMVNLMYEKTATCRTNIEKEIDSAVTSEAVRNFIDISLADKCSEEAEWLTKLSEDCYTKFFQSFEEEMLKFRTAFEHLFQDMDILEVELNSRDYSPPAKPAIGKSDFSAASSYVMEQIKKENRTMGGGLAAGALIGSAIVPGIGTLLGAFVGFIGGSFMNDYDAVKTKTKEKINTPLRNYFNNVVVRTEKNLNSYSDTLKNDICSEIDRYLAVYCNEVDRKIAEENQKKADIEKKISDIRHDMSDIENRKFRLSSVNTELNVLNRKET